MNFRKLAILIAATACAVAGWLWLWPYLFGTPGERVGGGKSAAVELEDQLASLAAWLGTNSNPAQIASRLGELKTRLGRMPKSVTAQALRNFLQSGADAPTHLDLKPEGTGALASASSLRVFLLDQLRDLDAAAALGEARRILARPTVPDEWALSLAILSKESDSSSQQLLQMKSRELARNPAWQANPSAGFLEAFDLFVFSRDTGFVPDLAAFLAATNNRALSHAAFLTLDRLVQSDPVPVLQALGSNPEWLNSRTATRAGYFARLDVRQPDQAKIMEDYLLNSGLGAEELRQFAGTFPNANFVLSQNLVTRPSFPDAGSLAARDRASLALVQAWLAEPRFRAIHPHLETIRARLETFVQPRP